MTRDPVTAELRIAIFERDRGCVAPFIDDSCGPCSGRLTLDHVQSGGGRMGKRAPSDREHLVSVCSAHMEYGARAGHQWNTAHRSELRAYLERVNA